MNIPYSRLILAVTVVSLFTLPVLAEKPGLERELCRLAEVSGGTMGAVMERCEREIAEVAHATHDFFWITSK